MGERCGWLFPLPNGRQGATEMLARLAILVIVAVTVATSVVKIKGA